MNLPSGPLGLQWREPAVKAAKARCRRCKRDMFVTHNWHELTDEQKADAVCTNCAITLMFNTSLE